MMKKAFKSLIDNYMYLKEYHANLLSVQNTHKLKNNSNKNNPYLLFYYFN
ncbi:hypothetical protein NHP164001_19050 [Helicobacter trogontum]|uniref:Uncharacterized protein n=1 Tax=Helicobacter trogontum TaxID=50960 RepID=A0ABQ0D6C1_9HELI